MYMNLQCDICWEHADDYDGHWMLLLQLEQRYLVLGQISKPMMLMAMVIDLLWKVDVEIEVMFVKPDTTLVVVVEVQWMK